MKKINRILALFLLFGGGLITSCEYEFIVEPEVVLPEPTDTISFSEEIVPIFNQSDNCTACHKTGGQAPDLSEANAYSSIVNGGLIDFTDTLGSSIYWHPHPDNTDEHTWKKYTSSEAALVLQWIKQGALDN